MFIRVSFSHTHIYTYIELTSEMHVNSLKNMTANRNTDTGFHSLLRATLDQEKMWTLTLYCCCYWFLFQRLNLPLSPPRFLPTAEDIVVIATSLLLEGEGETFQLQEGSSYQNS
eukprot:m.115431 g.115431  ORF g.115431 m.115431 type:complete len:114 (-) comp12839_c1_seq10:989-1330(-)